MNNKILITATGYYVPDDVITTEELVTSYNRYARRYNAINAVKIKLGICQELALSDTDFIINASGIKKRHVLNKAGILNNAIMHPVLHRRANQDLSIQAEFAMRAAVATLAKVGRKASDIDGVIIACSNFQRPFPAIAIEVQNCLGISGWAFDMNAACSSAAFGIATAVNAIKADTAKSVLVITPEIYTANINFTDRRSHFIFGDGAAACLIEKQTSHKTGFTIISSDLKTQFSNNIRNNFGFLNRCEYDNPLDNLFVQDGAKVRAEVVPLVANHIKQHLQKLKLDAQQIKRLWLHQANSQMNKKIAEQVLGHTPSSTEAPSILAEYGNTGAAGALIAFEKFSTDLHKDDIGIICGFGAGYTVGSVIIKAN